jgi:hypothetical protein
MKEDLVRTLSGLPQDQEEDFKTLNRRQVGTLQNNSQGRCVDNSNEQEVNPTTTEVKGILMETDDPKSKDPRAGDSTVYNYQDYVDKIIDQCLLFCDPNEPDEPLISESHPSRWLDEWFNEDDPWDDYDESQEFIERDYS